MYEVPVRVVDDMKKVKPVLVSFQEAGVVPKSVYQSVAVEPHTASEPAAGYSESSRSPRDAREPWVEGWTDSGGEDRLAVV